MRGQIWAPIDTPQFNLWFGTFLVTAIMLFLGISPTVVLFLVPFNSVTAFFVHANLNWTLGPLRFVVATPVFHRWHHARPGEGGNANFAPLFSLWDVLFGTFYMPERRVPANYGIDDPSFPQSFIGQLVYPFQHLIAFRGAREFSASSRGALQFTPTSSGKVARSTIRFEVISKIYSCVGSITRRNT
jgi:hypothetical protein